MIFRTPAAAIASRRASPLPTLMLQYLQGEPDRLAHVEDAREMHHRVSTPSSASRSRTAVAEVAREEAHSFRNRRPVPVREVVEDGHVVAGVAELAHGVAADVAGAAGDEHLHRRPIPW